MTKEDYPYEGIEGNSRFNYYLGVTKIRTYSRWKKSNKNNLKSLVTSCPWSAAIDTSAALFQLYTAGIYNERSCTTTNLNHYVAAVGNGNGDGIDYWIVRNSR